MYQVIVGEGGMSPEYFHQYLTFYEAHDYIEGINRRYHTDWSVGRWVTSSIAGACGAKDYHAPTFEWEKKKHKEDTITAEDLARMKEAGRKFAEELNKRARS